MGVRALLVAAVVLTLVGSAVYYQYFQEQPSCQVCHRPLHKGTAYQVRLKTGVTEHVCCPRCGLRFQRGRVDVVSARSADFATGELIDAEQAFYVEGSSQHLCCSSDITRREAEGGELVLKWDRCLPSLVAFRNQEDAEAFRRQNGGAIKTYAALLEEKD